MRCYAPDEVQCSRWGAIFRGLDPVWGSAARVC